MAELPDELWRRILEMGIESSNLSFRDLCCISISSRRLRRLSDDDSLWSTLLSSDFRQHNHNSSHLLSSSSNDNGFSSGSSSSKTLYKITFKKDRTRKLLAHKRAVSRLDSQIAERSRRLQELQAWRMEENDKMKDAVGELSNLQKARQASVALNVWQPEVIRTRQKQIVEQCPVSVDSRINALEMEIKLCRQQIAMFDKTYTDEKRRLEAAKEQLSSMKYHPLQDYSLKNTMIDEPTSDIRRKKLKR
ncbi:hypothetical protein Ancab_033213 [Ancistrocladus abbreviatus]